MCQERDKQEEVLKQKKEQKNKKKLNRKVAFCQRQEAAITLIALIVTIVVLLILAGITIQLVLADGGIFNQAQRAKEQTEIAQWREKLELAKNPIFIEGMGTFDVDKYFNYIQQQGIINDKTKDVIDNEDGTYDVTTKPGYIFEVALIPSTEKPTDAKITYIGQEGKILPIIKSLEVSATSTSITGKAIVSRLGNGTIQYYYKLKTENDSEYKEITNVNIETGATQSTGIVAGTEYIIKTIAKNDVGKVEKTAEITATKIFISSITLDKTTAVVKKGETINLAATVKPDDATNQNVTWESSNTSIATVTDTGVVTGKTAGTVNITVKAMDGSDKTATCEVTVLPTATDIVGVTQTTTKEVEDENGNKVVIPGGFKIVPNGTEDVTYTYADGKPCVQDGIVIEDDEGNQFVWIPVGEIKNKDNTTTTITLGRYTFDSNGTKTLQQDATNYSSTVTIESYYQELVSGSYGTPAKSLGTFVNRTKANSGYYIGRYEASYKDSTHCYSKKSTSTRTSNSTALTSGMLWNFITQPDAATVAKNSFTSSSVESDLINSYSWDTAIVFIQEYSGNSKYSREAGRSLNTSIANTGANGDKVCNIHDMRANLCEMATEHCVYTAGNHKRSAVRGGCYEDILYYTSSREYQELGEPQVFLGFRSLIYIK